MDMQKPPATPRNLLVELLGHFLGDAHTAAVEPVGADVAANVEPVRHRYTLDPGRCYKFRTRKHKKAALKAPVPVQVRY